VSAKPVKPPKHYPLRTCVGCRTVLPKRLLIRLVRLADGDGVLVDPTGKRAGRGAYLHNRRSCWQKGLNGTLAHALKTTLTTDDTQRLRKFMETLPEDEEETGEQA